jgi:hypothetical protein
MMEEEIKYLCKLAAVCESLQEPLGLSARRWFAWPSKFSCDCFSASATWLGKYRLSLYQQVHKTQEAKKQLK